MNLLAFETSLRRFSAALFANPGDLLVRSERQPGEWRGEELVDLLEGLCADAGRSWADLEVLAVAVGPGTFTGIRGAVAAARGLALATGLPIVPVGTLEAVTEMARSRHQEAGGWLAVLPGKRGELYAQRFDRQGEAVSPPGSVARADLRERLSPDLVVAGPSRAFEMMERLPARHVVAEPDAVAVGRIACRRLAAGGAPVAGRSVTPLYVRGPDADPRAGRPLVEVAG